MVILQNNRNEIFTLISEGMVEMKDYINVLNNCKSTDILQKCLT